MKVTDCEFPDAFDRKSVAWKLLVADETFASAWN